MFPQFLLGMHAPGDVCEKIQGRRFVLPTDPDCVDFGPFDVSPSVHDPEGVDMGEILTPESSLVSFGHQRAIVRMDEPGEGAVGQLLQGIPEEFDSLRVREFEPSVLGHQDGLARVVHQKAVLLLGFPQRVDHSLSFADVPDDSERRPSVFHLDGRQRKLHREFLPVLPRCPEFQRLPRCGRRRCLSELPKSPLVCLRRIRVGQQDEKVFSDHLRGGMAEHPLCCRVPVGDVTLVVQRDDHLLCGIDDPPQVFRRSLLALVLHGSIYSQFRRGSATEIA